MSKDKTLKVKIYLNDYEREEMILELGEQPQTLFKIIIGRGRNKQTNFTQAI